MNLLNAEISLIGRQHARLERLTAILASPATQRLFGTDATKILALIASPKTAAEIEEELAPLAAERPDPRDMARKLDVLQRDNERLRNRVAVLESQNSRLAAALRRGAVIRRPARRRDELDAALERELHK